MSDILQKQSPRKFAQKAASPRQGTRATEVTGWTAGQSNSGDNESLATQRGVKPDARGRHEDVLILRLAASHIDGKGEIFVSLSIPVYTT